MKKDTRIYGRPVEINTDSVKSFYERRAATAGETGYNAVLLGSRDPKAVEQKNQFERDYILPMLEINSTSRVLDIGCGIGRWAEFVLPQCGFYCGTDFTKGMVEATQSVCRRIGGKYQVYNLSYAETVAQTAEYFGGKFDVVIVAGVSMYINDQELSAIFRRLSKLLNSSCKLFFTEPVGLKKRLTLNEFPSEALQTTYSAIYRTPEEYNNLYVPFLDAGLAIIKQDFIPEYGDHYADTGRWFTVMGKQ